jgi:hypothetical protein
MQLSIEVKDLFSRKLNRLHASRNTLYYLPLTFTLIMAFFFSITFNLLGLPLIPSARASSGTTYYVSKNGNNADGRSWATAWNELANIKWSVVKPGDMILLDGGSQSMTYTTTLTVGQSGTRTAPITIERSTDVGRNGQVVLYGGGSPLPYCGQQNYTYQPSQTSHGMVFGTSSWIVIDGMNWGGISIHGFHDNGIDMTGGPGNDTLRNLQIYENGSATHNGNSWNPDTGGHGIYLTGTNLTFERLNIYDNADDEFDTGESPGVHNVTINYSWMHVTRESPLGQGLPFNECVHQDGYQIYDGGTQGNILFENSVVGPGLGEGVILGATCFPPANSCARATINNVTIKNSLFIGKDINIMGYPQVKETGWVIDHVTGVTPGNNRSPLNQALFLQGSNNTVTHSIFYEGNIYVPDGLVGVTGNCQWKTVGGNALGGKTVDPQFVTDISSFNYNTPLATMQNANYALQPSSPCNGAGSSITSVNSFLQLVTGATPALTPTPTPKSTPGSNQKPVVIATSVSPPNNNATVIVVVLGLLIFIGVISLFILFYRKSRHAS